MIHNESGVLASLVPPHGVVGGGEDGHLALGVNTGVVLASQQRAELKYEKYGMETLLGDVGAFYKK